MRTIPYILYLFLLSFHLTVLGQVISIQGVSFNMAILLVGLIALYKDESTAIWFGICAGILCGTQNFELMPWQILTLGSLAFVVNQFSQRINLDSIASRILLLLGAILIYLLISAAMISTVDYFYVIYREILPSALYTIIIAWIVLLAKDGYINWGKLKSLF